MTCVNQKERPFAGGNRAGNLVRKINVTRRIDKVQLVVVTVFRFVRNGNRLTFYRNAALALNIHVVENLVFHFALVDDVRFLNQTVGQRRFSVVDVRNNAKIALVFHVHDDSISRCSAPKRKGFE